MSTTRPDTILIGRPKRVKTVSPLPPTTQLPPEEFMIVRPGEADQLSSQTLISNLPLPPSITVDRVPLNSANSFIPGDIVFSKEGKVLKELINFQGHFADYKQAFSRALLFSLKDYLATWKIPLSGNGAEEVKPRRGRAAARVEPNYVLITGVKFYHTVDKKGKVITPAVALATRDTYEARMFLTFTEVDGSTHERIPGHVRDVEMGSVPIMLGSDLDFQKGKSDQELAAMAWEAADPGGYFIINGSNYQSVPRVTVREHRVIVYPDVTTGGNPYCSITVRKPGGTTGKNFLFMKKKTVRSKKDPRLGVILLSLRAISEDASINSFLALRLLYMELWGEVEARANYEDWGMAGVLDFVPPQHQELVRSYLFRTIINSNVENELEHIRQVVMPQSAKQSAKRAEELVDLAHFRSLLLNNLFEHIPMNGDQHDVFRKISLLCYMIARFAMLGVGAIKPDDRDNVANKQVLGAADDFIALILKSLRSTLGLPGGYIRRGRGRPPPEPKTYDTFANFISGIGGRKLTDDFGSSFSNNSWEVGGAKVVGRTAQITENTLVGLFTAVSKVNTPTIRRVKNAKMRMVQDGQFGFLCSISTPDGDGCGLVNFKAIGCFITSDKRHTIPYGEIMEKLQVMETRSEWSDSYLLIDGVPVGYCNGLQGLKWFMDNRGQIIDLHTMVLLEEGTLHVHSDAGRPTRPVLVVDQNTGQLLMDQKGLRGERWDTLEREGCVIYLDSWEQDHSLIAYSLRAIERERVQLREQTNRHRWTKSLVDYYLGVEEVSLKRIPDSYWQGRVTVSKPQCGPDGEVASLTGQPLVSQCSLGEFSSRMEMWDELLPEITAYRQERKELLSQLNELQQQLKIAKPEPVVDQATADQQLSQQQKHADLLTRHAQLQEQIDSPRSLPDWLSNSLEVEEIGLNKLLALKPYQYCEIDPNAILGYGVAISPFPDHNPPIRNTNQGHMAKQAMALSTRYNSYRLPIGDQKILSFPQRPIVQTEMYSLMGLNELPIGQNVTVAVFPHPLNEEDAVVINKTSAEMGMFTYEVRSKVEIVHKGGKATENFHVLVERAGKNYEKLIYYPVVSGGRVANVQAIGVGDMIEIDDCMIAYTLNGEDASYYAKADDLGTVEAASVGPNHKGEMVVTITIVRIRRPELGDKYAARCAQKSVVGAVVPAVDLPYSMETGRPADVYFSAFSMPTRMSLAMLMEILASKHGTLAGERVNASAWRENQRGQWEATLNRHGFSSSGTERYIDGKSGRMIEAELFTGPCVYQALPHNPVDKLQFLGIKGQRKPQTGQPDMGLQGRHGGSKFSEMEAASLNAGIMPQSFNDRSCILSDYHELTVCMRCSQAAKVGNPVDRVYTCSCRMEEGEKEDFRRLVVPYTTIALSNMLELAGIKMRIHVKPGEGEIRRAFR